MTPDDLERLVLENDDAWALPNAMAELDEAARAKLSSPAQKLYKQLYTGMANATASDRLKRVLASRTGDRWKHWNAKQNRRAALAIYGVGPLSAVRKREFYVWHDEWPMFDRIIRDRRPEWLDDWIEHQLEQDFAWLDFAMLRAWIRDGVCQKPSADGYFRKYASHLMRTGHYNRGEVVPPLSAQLLADPGLLDDVEGLFRVENNAFNTNSWLTKGADSHYESWTDALVKLSTAGTLDRARLLNLALEGLTRDLKQNQLSGFHGFYKRMAPAPDELIGHQQQYIDLLCHPVGHVVKFAIDMLGELEKKGRLDTDPVIREVQVVFVGASKGNATAALKLLKRIIARSKGADPAALGAVCEALRHGNAEVQDQALTILEASCAALAEAQLDAIQSAGPFVAVSNRARLSTLLSGRDRSPAPRGEPAPREVADSPSAATDYRPISDDINAQRILSDEDALTPFASFDELIEAMLHAVEVVDSPDEIERIVDGISRFANERPFDFDQRVAPLLHRIKQGAGRNGMAVGYAGVGLALLDLVCTWLTGRLHRTDRNHSYYAVDDGFEPLITYLRGITERVARHERRQLLSTPTHKGGWIDPVVWIKRLTRLQAGWNGIPASIDFRLSLLRLAPDNRAQALADSGAVDPSIRRIVQFALGGDEHPRLSDRNNYATWITAARCRSPFEDWTAEFEPLKLHDELPDSLQPAQYEWDTSRRERRYGTESSMTAVFGLRIGCGDNFGDGRGGGGLLERVSRTLRGRLSTDWRQLPTTALTRQRESRIYWGDTSTTWVAQWLAYVWPQNPSAAYMKGAVKLTQRINQDSSIWSPAFGHFQALFQKNRPWLEGGHLLLSLGLAGKDADAKGLAVDALIEGIDGRRFDPALFVATIARLSEEQWVKFNRLGDSLMQAVRVSELHAAVIGDALEAWLPRLDLQQRNAFHVLEVLVEAQAMANRPLGEEAKTALSRITGSGKSAKIAKQLAGA